ncbi:MAG TPA: BLUF domain-containing protein [Pseudoxanthomonas sp.]|nr:BLUF domain-containing protein [Pseudoxanthomonas sp.]
MTDTHNLAHLIYTSSPSSPFDPGSLRQILDEARASNARRGVTGMLLYTRGSFFQVLEGEDQTLQGLFERICADPRHSDVVRIIHEPIARRMFGDWTMGYVEVDPPELLCVEGLEDFLMGGQSLSQLGAGRAKKLLMAFTAGHWRRSPPDANR